MQQPASAEQTHQNGYKMRKLIFVTVFMAMTVSAMAQTAERYRQRYELLVSQFGPAGVGVETVLDNWAKVDSTSADFLFARFSYYFTKAQTTEVVSKPGKKYLLCETAPKKGYTFANDPCIFVDEKIAQNKIGTFINAKRTFDLKLYKQNEEHTILLNNLQHLTVLHLPCLKLYLKNDKLFHLY